MGFGQQGFSAHSGVIFMTKGENSSKDGG